MALNEWQIVNDNMVLRNRNRTRWIHFIISPIMHPQQTLQLIYRKSKNGY